MTTDNGEEDKLTNQRKQQPAASKQRAMTNDDRRATDEPTNQQ
jgi:hypothetical protein